MVIVRRSKVKWLSESITYKIFMYYILCTQHAYNLLNYCYEVWGNTYENKIQSLYMLQKKPITICKPEGYLSQARHIISYYKPVWVYDMIDLYSMVFMFKLTTICFQIIYVKLL